jgi:branched-chain amino acid transport system permease protein
MMEGLSRLQLSRGWLLAILAGGVAAALPFLVSTFWLRIGTGLVMWMALAQSWNMIGGYTGLISFGQGAFFGLGAYVTAILIARGWPFGLALVPALIAPALLAGVIGMPTLRLKGAYFAIATWAFAEFVRQAALVSEITGGSTGMRVRLILEDQVIYYIMLTTALAWLLLAWWLLEARPFGLRLRAIRDHELAAEMLGMATTRIKMQAFTLSAAVAGLFGGLYGVWITFLHPDNTLAPAISDQMVVMTLIGGIGSFVGPLVGALVLYAIERTLWLVWSDNFGYLAVIGTLVVLVVLFMPDGVAGLFAGRKPSLRLVEGLRRLGHLMRP